MNLCITSNIPKQFLKNRKKERKKERGKALYNSVYYCSHCGIVINLLLLKPRCILFIVEWWWVKLQASDEEQRPCLHLGWDIGFVYEAEVLVFPLSKQDHQQVKISQDLNEHKCLLPLYFPSLLFFFCFVFFVIPLLKKMTLTKRDGWKTMEITSLNRRGILNMAWWNPKEGRALLLSIPTRKMW